MSVALPVPLLCYNFAATAGGVCPPVSVLQHQGDHHLPELGSQVRHLISPV